MSKENQFTSTGIKLLHHPFALAQAKAGLAIPISLQISPTSKCNLNCVFCSNSNRTKEEQLHFSEIQTLLTAMKSRHLKTVEWTGGGDPTLYPEIEECISYANNIGLKQGFITNGIKFAENISQEHRNILHWVRISMNCLDYIDDIEIPTIEGTLGFSYVMNTETSKRSLDTLKLYVDKYKPAYVRIVPNCIATDEEQERNNKVLSSIVKSWGEPFFYQEKIFKRPTQCWWGYYKPYVGQDGFVYRCNSVVLNHDADRQFQDKYRWCRIADLPYLYDWHMIPFDTKDCNHCVFTTQNNLIDSIVNPNGQEDFV